MAIDFNDLLGSSLGDLTVKEREYFLEVLKEEVAKRDKASVPRQVRDIVPIEDWIMSEYYTGIPANQIYDYWKDLIVDIFREDRKPEERINQLVLSGSIGIGKSTCAELVVLRKLYEMSCWENVNAMYHLMSKTNIMFMYFSVNKIQAERTGFGDLKRLVDGCPYFQQNFKRKERLDTLLTFPEGICITYGSNENHTIGMSTICSILDEANFMGQSGGPAKPEKALEMYTSLVNRSNSRFIIDGGINHSLNILVSSSTTESSVTERVIANSKDDPHTLVCAPSQWEVKPEKFSKKFFYVCKGTDYLEPFIVRSTDDVNNFRISEGLKKEKYIDGIEDFSKIQEHIEKLPTFMQSSFLKVPEDLRRGFENNMLRSLQDIGGVSVGSTGRLFNSVTVYNSCIDERFKHPFILPSITVATGDNIEVKDFLRADFALKHPERPRFLHIDQSYRTDDTGISMVYVDDIIEEDGVKKPVFGVDFMIQINPPKPPRKIAIYKIRNFVVWLAKYFNVKIGKVTYDIFNSEESRQILEEMGFSVGYQSVDRTDKAYLDTIEIMYEGRLKMYDYSIFRSEIFNVIHYRDKRKIDHPRTNPDGSTGKKDVADSLCLSYDTKLFLLSGKELTIEELYSSFNSTEEWVLAYDIECGDVKPVKIEKVIQKSKIPSLLYKISLDNGKSFSVTGDHLVLNSEGSYIEAKDLSIGDSLMSFELDKVCLKRVITSISIVGNTNYVYDLQLGSIHNFGIQAGVFVHNCGAIENALSFKIEDSARSSHISDFMAANGGNIEHGIFNTMSVEERIDKEIDSMIQYYEDGMNNGFMF